MVEAPATASQSAPDDSIGWITAIDGLRGVAERLAAHVPTDDPGAAAELAMKMLGTMMGAYLQQVRADPDHPVFLPSAGFYTMYGSPNPDTIYRTTAIDDQGQYLISGHRGSVPEITVMPFGGPTATGLQTFPHFDLSTVAVNDDGTFEVTVSQDRPAATETGTGTGTGTGDWWQLEPGTRTLMLRTVSDDWAVHTEPRIAITRLDRDPRRTRLAPEAMAQHLQLYGLVVEGMAMSGINRVEALRQQGAINRLVDVDYSNNGGLATQWYQEGCFSLGADEALLIEARLPTGCDAFSLSLTDAFFSTIDWANAQSSLNQRQAGADSDGVIRVVVSPTDPGLANWLDTTGHRFGVVQCRWMGGKQSPEVTVQTVPVTTLAGRLPGDVATVTASQRAATVRARQIGVQLRTSW